MASPNLTGCFFCLLKVLGIPDGVSIQWIKFLQWKSVRTRICCKTALILWVKRLLIKIFSLDVISFQSCILAVTKKHGLLWKLRLHKWSSHCLANKNRRAELLVNCLFDNFTFGLQAWIASFTVWTAPSASPLALECETGNAIFSHRVFIPPFKDSAYKLGPFCDTNIFNISNSKDLIQEHFHFSDVSFHSGKSSIQPDISWLLSQDTLCSLA